MLGFVPKHSTPAGDGDSTAASDEPAAASDEPAAAGDEPAAANAGTRSRRIRGPQIAIVAVLLVIGAVFAMQLSESAGSGPVAQTAPTTEAATPFDSTSVEPTPSPTPSPTAVPSPTPTPTPAPTVLTPSRTPSTHRTTTTHPRTTKPPTTKPPTTKPPAKPTYAWATTAGPVLGTAGSVRHFRIAVDSSVGVSLTDFENEVDATLGDPRSWIASGSLRLQRVAQNASYNFTIYLASPSRAYSLCIAGGIDIRVGGTPYTSCRVGNNVVINSARYLNGVPNYGAPLSDYRQYVINHEVGHWLGHNHQLCPGAGKLAPVMEQQTLGLKGCVANSWPYVDGKLYSGPSA